MWESVKVINYIAHKKIIEIDSEPGETDKIPIEEVLNAM